MNQFNLSVAMIATILMFVQGCTQLDTQNRDSSNRQAIEVAGTKQHDLSRYRAPLDASVTNRRFDTLGAMYLANEMELGSFDFVTRSAKAGLRIDPDFLHIATVESYWYSRYNMSALTTESRMGVGVVYSPYVSEWALKEGRSTINRDRGEYVRSNKGVLLQEITPWYLERTGFPRRFEDASPIMLTFASGDPHYVRPLDKGIGFESTENILRNNDLRKLYGDDYPEQESGMDKRGNPEWKYRVNYRENFLSLRWDTDKMEKVIDLGAEGQVLMKQVLWAEFFLNGTRNNDKYLGITPEDGFRGAMLNLMAVSKMLMLKSTLLYDGKKLTGADPRSAKPGEYYFPHRVAVRMREVGDFMPRPEEFSIDDPDSHLFDQASLLWALSEFYRYASPTSVAGWKNVFGDNTPYDGSIMEQKYAVLAEGLANMIIANINVMHRRKDGSVASFWSPQTGTSQATLTRDIGMSLLALSHYLQYVKASPEITRLAEDLVRTQTSYLLQTMRKSDGSFNIGTEASRNLSDTPSILETQAFAIRGLLEAGKVLNEAAWREAALATYSVMNRDLWIDNSGLYRTDIGGNAFVYTPKLVGAVLGAMRELIITTSDNNELARYKRFWVQAVNSTGLQQSEYEETGEVNLSLRDGDKDGIPRMEAAGGRFGIAPVFASEVLIKVN